MSHSTHVGFSEPPIASDSGRLFRAIVAAEALPERQSRLVGVGKVRADSASISVPPGRSGLVSGVGHNPDPVTTVRRTNGGSWYAVPFRIKPERGQVSEYRVQPSTKQRCNVLHDAEARSKLANKTGEFPP